MFFTSADLTGCINSPVLPGGLSNCFGLNTQQAAPKKKAPAEAETLFLADYRVGFQNFVEVLCC